MTDAKQIDVTYVAIPAESTSKPLVEVTSYVVPQDKQKRRMCCGSLGCCLLVGLVLTVFFLIPRSPSATFEYLTLESTSSGGIGLKGKFEFSNNNFYEVAFSKSDINMYWLNPSGSSCDFTIFVGYACGYTAREWCAQELGEFSQDGSFTVDSRGSEERTLSLNPTLDGAARLVAAAASPSGSALFLTKGTLDAKSDMHNFGTVHVDETLYCYMY